MDDRRSASAADITPGGGGGADAWSAPGDSGVPRALFWFCSEGVRGSDAVGGGPRALVVPGGGGGAGAWLVPGGGSGGAASAFAAVAPKLNTPGAANTVDGGRGRCMACRRAIPGAADRADAAGAGGGGGGADA